MRRPALVLVLAACTSFTPGAGVIPAFAEAWCCDAKAVQDRAIRKSADLPLGYEFIPEVGWTSCELLDSDGQPTRVESSFTAVLRDTTLMYLSDTVVYFIAVCGSAVRQDSVGIHVVPA